MKTKFFRLLLVFTVIAISANSYATEKGPYTPMPKKAFALKNNSNKSEERRKAIAAEYNNWKKMSEKEKIAYLEKKRLEKLKQAEAKWKTISAAKKIEQQEKLFQRQTTDPKAKQQEAQQKLIERCAAINARTAQNAKQAPVKSAR